MRAGSTFGWCVLTGLVLVGGGWLALDRMRLAQMREEIAALRDNERDLARLRAENKRLAAESISPAALEALRADRAAVIRLRAELEALKARPVVRASAPVPMPDSMPKTLSATESRNMGRATAAASFETVVWAAGNQDVETLNQSIALEGAAQKKADELFARLPAEDRKELGTADRLVAYLTARDVLSAKMSVLAQMPLGEDGMVMKVLVEGSDGSKRMPTFSLRRYPDGWKLMVPESAIDKYAAFANEQMAKAGSK
jgi:hypothetical protein